MHPLLLAALVAMPGASVSGTVTLASGAPARDAVVFLDGGGEKATPLRRAVIDQRDKEFIPHVTVVTVGTKVDFPNDDVVFHSVFTEYHSQRFDLGTYARGRTKTQVFDVPGLAVLLCSIHPKMSAYVMCVDTPYYAKTDSRGRFTIPGVATGTYTARVWHESGGKSAQEIAVKGDTSLRLRMAK